MNPATKLRQQEMRTSPGVRYHQQTRPLVIFGENGIDAVQGRIDMLQAAIDRTAFHARQRSVELIDAAETMVSLSRFNF